MTDLFARAGALRPAYEAVDWSATTFGAVETWSPALRSSIDLLLGTRFPVTLLWGSDFALLYNEAYVEMIVDKHPAALGAPGRQVFPEAWHLIGPMLEQVRETGEAIWLEDELVPLLRSGFLEECYFTFSYSPVRASDESIVGVMDIASETTAQVVARRRLRLLTYLASALVDADDLEALRATAADQLTGPDLPEVALWLPGTGDVRPEWAPADIGGEIAVSGDGTRAWLPLPVTQAAVEGALLSVVLNPQRPLDADYQSFLGLLAASLARAADRVVGRAAERTLSTALQRSLLTPPVRSAALDIAVRYQPAVEIAQIGGDWYDSFRLPDGSLAIVVGDVAGHDQDAAATMGQLRNLTRGVAHSVAGSPAAVLAGVDHAVIGLDLGVIATAVLVQVREETRTARWSSAGHLPPVLVEPDGRARLLETRPDLLIGLDPTMERSDHEVELAPGSTLVLYTDGLAERRDVHIQDSLDWLAEVLAGSQDQSPDEICDRLLALTSDSLEDDVALLVLRIG